MVQSLLIEEFQQFFGGQNRDHEAFNRFLTDINFLLANTQYHWGRDFMAGLRDRKNDKRKQDAVNCKNTEPEALKKAEQELDGGAPNEGRNDNPPIKYWVRGGLHNLFTLQ
jgi:hypothetical protein